ncbi:MAG: hypothetical protein A2W61_01845 [Deltaproteobacteria bacterium RIFCSPLOWO2_01_44_7]|nr:MAG: hypothetical protein A2712_03325 [Deltaproteobacteria bacterium RIFCSPHIGHO2_01_FULL_43_49]OGQ16225.1 MAG: hypothetical protein A3D22_01295 [Deltaproteobacteria bacterium RIFCSPHIGHO2_02_FULL_44_53]OGQ29185.1 MAG: hypothetical protein A3D98_05080 [Deltaproteobacteria bacterium RIFCSPHIGHO2_12_FULL_44_21]OGQ32742.1 MAG: hypothetical protein A2979_09225 [Deltaproteobacteria bacterium RIFCSPLOWO2_01_FULL_45_74]OGQ39947.1 MAG: hypothetical protein A2W61_01845 [Deltaproteobacteria bacterium 
MKNLKNKKGFSLIEAILTMTILAFGIVGVLTIYQQNIERADEMEQTLIASALAQEKLEQIIHDKKYQSYDYIIQSNYPTETLASEGYAGYTRTTTITAVSPSNLSSPPQGNEAGYTKVTVSVQDPAGDIVSFDTLVTDWGEE